MESITYNCWHGCHKKSEGCMNCYVYRSDSQHDKDASVVYKTKDFDLPIRKNRKGEYKYPSGSDFATCFTSDFFVEDADEWRDEVLRIIKERSDCHFFLITKRPERIIKCIPDLVTYKNLDIFCTMENQKRFDERAPIYLSLPVIRKIVIVEPMLGPIDMHKYLDDIDEVYVGGESGPDARMIDFEWVKDIKKQCKEKSVFFSFRQTGANIKVNGKLYHIKRKDQFTQAKKAFKTES